MTWRLRQVEINTISSAFPALAPRVTALHRYLAHRFGATGHPDAALPESSSGAAPLRRGSNPSPFPPPSGSDWRRIGLMVISSNP